MNNKVGGECDDVNECTVAECRRAVTRVKVSISQSPSCNHGYVIGFTVDHT